MDGQTSPESAAQRPDAGVGMDTRLPAADPVTEAVLANPNGREEHATDNDAANAERGAPDPPRRPTSPDEFYHRVTQRPDIREILRQLAQSRW
jgi:hypothetical protein